MTIKEYFDKQEWTFAKTYANKAPHYYIVRGRTVGSDEEFMWAKNFVLRHGAPMYYYGHPNKYLYLEGWWYWVMQSGDDTMDTIINRCKADEYYVSTVWKGKMK